jgi:uncharacterized protein (TIGR03435 family)
MPAPRIEIDNRMTHINSKPRNIRDVFARCLPVARENPRPYNAGQATNANATATLKSSAIPRFVLATAFALVCASLPLVCAFAEATQSGAQQSTQSAAQEPAPHYTFASVSIKPHVVDPYLRADPTHMQELPDGLTLTNLPMLRVISMAYGLENVVKIQGAPDWLHYERYDITAKMDPATSEALEKLSPEQRRVALQGMLQVMLADRLKLSVHDQIKKVYAYFLEVADTQIVSKVWSPASPYAGDAEESDDYDFRGQKKTTVSFRAVTMAHVIATLQPAGRYIIVDRTGLTGVYNITVTFDSQQLEVLHMRCDQGPCPGDWPIALFKGSSASHLVKKLGLKLVYGKRPVDFMVIDHVEQPSVN